ncbi:MAG: hypothetical protein G01um10147_257 [Microgenomates group bacterium Gr01-1014_7]|nr:MAG: hypothetical protein G01um10147_257 [Microgenomates group bacterium Gr01-1014_7]
MANPEINIKPKHLAEGRALVAQHILDGKVIEERAIYKILGRRLVEGQEPDLLLQAQGGQVIQFPESEVLRGGNYWMRITGILSREEVAGIFFAPIK